MADAADKELKEIQSSVLSEKKRADARERCFSLLTKDRHLARIRLALARSYYLDGYWEFALRELSELRRYSSAPALQRLIEALENTTGLKSSELPVTAAADEEGEEGVVAEIDIDSEIADALAEFEEQKK